MPPVELKKMQMRVAGQTDGSAPGCCLAISIELDDERGRQQTMEELAVGSRAVDRPMQPVLPLCFCTRASAVRLMDKLNGRPRKHPAICHGAHVVTHGAAVLAERDGRCPSMQQATRLMMILGDHGSAQLGS